MKIFTNINRLIISTVIFVLPVLCNAETKDDFPSSFPTVEAMIAKLGDYSEEIGTFKIIKQNPLHIQLSPRVMKGENLNEINEMVQRTIMYGVYRTFIHTNVNQITVTVIPKELDPKKSIREGEYKNEYKQTISKSRKEALALAQKYLGISSFSQMVTETKIGDIVIPYQWSADFKRAYYNDKGSPGLTRFVNELSKKQQIN